MNFSRKYCNSLCCEIGGNLEKSVSLQQNSGIGGCAVRMVADHQGSGILGNEGKLCSVANVDQRALVNI